MRVLLDTHAFPWFINGDERLSDHARLVISDPANDRLLSVASLWEMAIKSSLGRLTLGLPFPELVRQHVRRNAMRVLPIGPAHLVEVVRLPFYHKDPFNRLIIAQAVAEGVPVLSRDGVFNQYPVAVLWERP